MRIVFISDTHSRLRHMKVPDGDMVVHSGDATMSGKLDEVAHFAKVFGELPHKHRVAIAGNHDWMAERDPELFRKLLEERGIVYLFDQEATLDGVRIWGSPWQPEFFDWAFNLPREGTELQEKWALIPEGIDILVTHGPPLGQLDVVPRDNGFQSERVGCYDLAQAIERVKPKIHAFGHIHCGYGVAKKDGTLFVNASNCDDQYQASQDPIVVEMNNGNVEVVHVGERRPFEVRPRLWL